MSFISVPFDQIDKIVDTGTYVAEVFSAGTKPTSTDGSTMIEWYWAIIDDGPNKGRKLVYRSNLADQKDAEAQRKAHYYLNEYLKTIKCPTGSDGFNLEDAIHCKALIRVEHEVWQGKPIAKIAEVLALPE